MIVVDSGAFLEVLLGSHAGGCVAADMSADDSFAPHLIDAEILHRLTMAEKHGHLTSEEVDTGVLDLRAAPIERIDHDRLLSDARRMTTALSGYDALYVALARLLSCRLLTADGRMARTARDHFGVTAIDVFSSGRHGRPAL